MSLTATYHLAQACLCGYTGFLSYTAIQKLLLYEERTEQAAQYSHTAADQLHKTRTTQASGAVAVRAHEACQKPHQSNRACFHADIDTDTLFVLLLSVPNLLGVGSDQDCAIAMCREFDRPQSCLLAPQQLLAA